MINWVARSLEGMSRCFGRGLSGFDAIISSSLAPANRRREESSEEEFERIRQGLWRLRRDLDQLADASFFQDTVKLLKDAFGGADGFVSTVRAWANLIDKLVMEVESDFGSQPGRGPYKKRHVKGAILYLVKRTDLDIPRVPSFIEPIVWDVALDPMIDIIARVSNRNQLWEDVPATPSLRARVNAAAQRVGSIGELLVRWLTKISWSLVFLFSPVSPRLKTAVDEFLRENPEPFRSVLIIASWVVRNTGNLVIVSDLFSIVVVEAQFVEEADEKRRKIYARNLVLAFLDDEFGIPDRGTLGFHLLVTIVDVGVEVVAMLFDKHGFFAPSRAKLVQSHEHKDGSS